MHARVICFKLLLHKTLIYIQLTGISIDIRLLLNFVYMMCEVIAFNPTMSFIIRLCSKELPCFKLYFATKY